MPALGPAPLVYLITDRTQTGGRPVEQVIEQALAAWPRAGVPSTALAVQLREKDLPAAALLPLALRLRDVTARAGVRLFVNDRVDVALAAGADGVHVGGASLSVPDVRALAPALQIAVSTHTLDEVRAAATSPHDISFVVFGPVFDTPSKRGYGPPVGIDRLHEASAIGIPVVALGGIEPEKIAVCRQSGASGIACIRAVLRNNVPAAALTRIFETIEST